MATVPLSGTDIRLLSSIPFSNDYKNTRWFDTIADQMTYFNSKPIVHSLSEYNFQRIEGHSFIAVNKNIDSLWGINYVMFRNTEYNNKWFYGFVTKLEYKQQNNTYVHFQIDVLQTWMFEMNFKPSYVIREHCKLWESDGSPVINTIDEGLNYGVQYDTTEITQFQPNQGYKWLVIITKSPMHDGAANKVTPTVIGTPQPLSVYVVPFKDNDTVPNVFLTKNNVGVVISKPTEVLTHIYSADDAVNNVTALYITDHIGLPVTISETTMTFPDNGNELEPAQIMNGTDFFNCLYITKVKSFSPYNTNIGDKYSGYHTVKESKLLMHPYTQLILDDFKGNRVSFKNEYINHQEIQLLVKGSLGTSNKTSYGIPDYNFSGNDLWNELSDENALINSDPNDIPIINDMLSAFLQGNRNSLHVQKNSTIFNGAANTITNGASAVASGFSGLNPVSAGAGMVSAGVHVAQGAGNTVLQLQAIQAKQSDISNTPPQLAKMGSNTSYTIGNEYNGVYIIKKHIKPEYIKKLEYFFGMFGYKVNEVKIPNFHTRQNWNYVQTSSCMITGNFNNDDLNELKSIFDNGITLWHTDDIGNYSLENGVI